MVKFEAIDGNYVKPENACGYCLYYDGVLTEKLTVVHKCKRKNDGKPCIRYCGFRIRKR